ncbi:MAG: segregation/condensation protein A [Oscillospiraceae bacterium]|nr:segregation/condensation protein A [Oscillospiraceae bacterium]
MEAPIYHLDKVVKAKQEDLEDFDGPLDLILHLLSKNKIEIRDINISQLLDQYLAWMAQREELNLEVASEFVTMAAHLVYIKTRMLLSIDDEVAMSEMEELMAALEEHKSQETYVKIKDITGALSGQYEFGRDYLTKQPEPVKVNNTYTYVHDKGDILAALRSLLARTDSRLPPATAAFEGIVGREPYPVADKARSILDRLIQFGVARFRALFKTSRSRSEVVATFLAILELCKANRIHLAGTAEDCTVTSTVDDLPESVDVTVESY